MPFFREIFDDDDVPLSAAETETPPRPVHSSQMERMPLGILHRRLSEESIRTDLCEGPIPDIPTSQRTSPEPELDTTTTTTSDRSELIERLKRGESPTWIPFRRVCLVASNSVHANILTADQHDSFPHNGSRDHSPSPRPKSRGSPSLLTASLQEKGPTQESDNADQRLAQGLDIERPRSALHSGDFTQILNAPNSRFEGEAGKKYDERRRGLSGAQDYRLDDEDHAASWLATSPPRDFIAPFRFERRIPFPDLPDGYRSSPPSLSSSLSSTLYRHPTSPLVHSESNDDLSINSMNLDPETPTRRPRRQTSAITTPAGQRIPTMRREGAFPYQAHQPRKSLTSVPTFAYIPGSSPQPIPSAAVSSRRPSIALESSPLQRTSLVGSYEESILRGRMSTTPSKPFDFLAQIGVLGLGANCKSSLRCPAHVTLPFPAVFYSYASSNTPGHGDDGPSPYVGQIDLENGLSNPDEVRRRRNSRQRSGSAPRRPRPADGDGDVDMAGNLDMMTLDAREVAKHQRRRRHNANTNSSSSTTNTLKAPPGGSYRIPEKGQLQIIIKNHNKTAVKLFLIPYDLEGMEPGTKTFIRQRSYSSGPIIAGTTDAADEQKYDSQDKPVLRYLVHLHICCPARGRYYLYRSIRVVFANRVPDGKEKLRNEITLPEPRFTPYKAVRQMFPPPPPPSTATSSSLAAEKAFRRRSSGFSFGAGGSMILKQQPPVPELPAFEKRARAFSAQDRGVGMLGGTLGPGGGTGASGIVTPLRFAKGEVGGAGGTVASTFAGGPYSNVGVGSGVAIAESLLSQRLRSLGMQGVCRGEMEVDSEEAEG